MIELNNTLVPAVRTGFIANRAHDMKYVLGTQVVITGRYRWTYP